MDKPSRKQKGLFPTTHWSLIERARESEKTVGREALEELLRKYRRPLLLHLQYKFRASPEQREDWLHDFIKSKFLENRLLSAARQEKGQFRSFVTRCLNNFVREQITKAAAAKRGPKAGHESINDPEFPELGESAEESADPGDIQWARQILERAIEKTRQWYSKPDKEIFWRAFEMARLEPLFAGKEKPSDRGIAEACGMPEKKVSNTVLTVVRRFKAEIRRQVIEYLPRERDGDLERKVDEEILALQEILIRAASLENFSEKLEEESDDLKMICRSARKKP